MTDPRRTIEGILSCDPDDFDEIESSVADLPHVDATRLLSICRDALSNPVSALDEAIRLSCVKVLVALLPNSAKVIEALLLERSEHAYEVHFSLFCFLDQVPCNERLEPSSSFVLSLVRTYLRDVPADDAHAAWMAGDMIGDHWPNLDEATEVLVEIVSAARFPAGKESALHGISHLLGREGLTAECRSRLAEALQAVVSAAPESAWGRSAREVLKGFGCGGQNVS